MSDALGHRSSGAGDGRRSGFSDDVRAAVAVVVAAVIAVAIRASRRVSRRKATDGSPP
ncbi:hypothetical protein KSP35_22770 [Aquihabitans sp. G128]|uniref:hypothetical protein n=1 Tax=Aquihabitans sp. G128 TaxID=2849779 RepID=UPI001C20FE2F|nr:hypothetical protein [Aquihabitans sp. G128]QXC61101.1 hypothetical protein KSP35_22770 [Aquihabitans sp. G128]